MSGGSRSEMSADADGVDAALVEWPEGEAASPFELLAFHDEPVAAGLQERIHRLAAGRVEAGAALRDLAALDIELGERFAAAAAAVYQSRFAYTRAWASYRAPSRASVSAPGEADGRPGGLLVGRLLFFG